MTPQNTLSERSVSRRWVLGGLSATTALVVTGCAATSASTTTSSSAASSATTSAAAAATSSSAASTTTSAAVEATAAATPSARANARTVARLARAFLATLDADQKATVLQDYSLTNAENWSNLPQGLIGGGGGPGGSTSSSGGRVGISLGDLSSAQLKKFNTLMKAATGSSAGLGWDEITMHLDADDYLGENGGGDTYGRENFYLAFLGKPRAKGTWELQFGGHHLAVANTYTDGQLVGATPSFRGIEPNGRFTWDGETMKVMRRKERAFTAMLASLTSAQQSTAQLSDVYSDLALGPGNDWQFPTTREGLRVGTLSAAQKKKVLAAIGTYVHDVADADAAVIMKRYRSEINKTYVAWSGTTALTERNDYVRIDGPSVWIEFSMQGGIVLSGNHPHSVWRDRVTDYGGTGS
ncbi:DUF3500 domain-containing protein [Nocardioides bruguierae]|uniref:DUF3500 domain-containing protein n=1 Tax=Nocardioides bruguierae TaxID=2945102 RepID=A0A9X2D626_9ACTN|nr:DUF3500 domain-containing protein [Nocardioides bruguierae]MCM0619517.1 DUF3500 domain-containing protein [Nocardioides bruguierae]